MPKPILPILQDQILPPPLGGTGDLPSAQGEGEELPWTETPPPGDFERPDIFPSLLWGLGYDMTRVGEGIESYGARLSLLFTDFLHLDSRFAGLPMPVFFVPRLEAAFGSEHQAYGAGLMIGLPLPDLIFFYLSPIFRLNRYDEEWQGSFDLALGAQFLIVPDPHIMASIEYAPLGFHAGLEETELDPWTRFFSVHQFSAGLSFRF